MKAKVISILTTEIDYGPYLPTWQVDALDAALNDVLSSLNLGFNSPDKSGEVTPFRAKITASRILTDEDYESFRLNEISSQEQKLIKRPISKTVTVLDDGTIKRQDPLSPEIYFD